MPEAKEAILKLRVTGSQKRLFEEAARVDGLSLSEWVRRQSMLRASEILIRGTAQSGT